MNIYRILPLPPGAYACPASPKGWARAPAANDIMDGSFWAWRQRRPWDVDLFQLLRRIDAEGGQRFMLGRAPLPRYESLRLGQRPSLNFAPANVAAIFPAQGKVRRRVDINGFGLFGPNGPLPLHMTEEVYQRSQRGSFPAAAAFANLFHHRLIALFYRAWADAQHGVSFDRPDNRRFDRFAACLLGMNRPAPGVGSADAQARYYMSGHLTRQPRSAAGLRAILSHHFATPVAVKENQFQWLSLPENARLRLGDVGQNARLGKTHCLGVAVPDIQSRFAVTLGPMPWRQYCRLLPADSSGALIKLTDWIRHYVGVEFAWEARLRLAAGEYQGYRLGNSQPLGRSSWLGLNVTRADRDDFIYRPETLTGS